MNKSKAAMKRAKWLAYCLEIGWDKHLLPRLEKVWDSYYNENGIRRPINIQEQPQVLNTDIVAQSFKHEVEAKGNPNKYPVSAFSFRQGGMWLKKINQSQEQPIEEDEYCNANSQYRLEEDDQPIESEDEWIKTATIWCEVVHTVLEAHKNNEEVGSFIPNVLEKQFIITRK